VSKKTNDKKSVGPVEWCGDPVGMFPESGNLPPWVWDTVKAFRDWASVHPDIVADQVAACLDAPAENACRDRSKLAAAVVAQGINAPSGDKLADAVTLLACAHDGFITAFPEDARNLELVQIVDFDKLPESKNNLDRAARELGFWSCWDWRLEQFNYYNSMFKKGGENKLTNALKRVLEHWAAVETISSAATPIETAAPSGQPAEVKPTATESDSDMLTTPQAAAFANVSEKTILNWHNSKDQHGNPVLPGAKIHAGKLFVPRGDLKHLIKPERTRTEPPKKTKKTPRQKPVKK